MSNFRKAVEFFLTIVVTTFLNGFVLMKLYNWFIVDIYSLQSISMMQGIAIMAIINFIKAEYKKPEDGFWTKIFSFFNCGSYNQAQNRKEVALNPEFDQKLRPIEVKSKTIKKYN